MRMVSWPHSLFARHSAVAFPPGDRRRVVTAGGGAATLWVIDAREWATRATGFGA